jgi:hypothetical protein
MTSIISHLEPILFTLTTNFIGYCHSKNWTIWNIYSSPFCIEINNKEFSQPVFSLPRDFPIDSSALLINEGEYQFKFKDFSFQKITFNPDNRKTYLALDLKKLSELELIDLNKIKNISLIYSPWLAFGYTNQNYALLKSEPVKYIINALYERLWLDGLNPEKEIEPGEGTIKFNNSQRITIRGTQNITYIKYSIDETESILDFNHRKISINKKHSYAIYSALEICANREKLINCNLQLIGDSIDCQYIE